MDAPFADILCAVDGSRAAAEAARQAIALAKPDAAVCFMAVSHTTGVGLVAQAELSENRAEKALEDAARLAQAAGISASIELRKGGHATELLLEEARGHDLLVLGSHGASRAGGIMIGSTRQPGRPPSPAAAACGAALAGCGRLPGRSPPCQ